MTDHPVVRLVVLVAMIGCGPARMIEMPYQPLPAPEFGSGPVDVIRDLEAPGQLPPLHNVRLPDGDIEYRFGIVGHMALGGTNTIVRVIRSAGVARGEVWCHRLAWESKDPQGRMPHQIARTFLERSPDWGAVLDSIAAVGLMRYSGAQGPADPIELPPGDPSDRISERPLVPRGQTDQATLLFEGREGAVYRSLGIYGRTPEDRPEWPRVQSALRAVWGDQKYACSELSSETEEDGPILTTQWIIRPTPEGSP